MKTNLTFVGVVQGVEWPHFLWLLNINGQVFEYKTGLGNSTKYFERGGHYDQRRRPKDRPVIANSEVSAWIHVPAIDEVLHCLFSDGDASTESFSDFCGNLGYSDDSIKALNIYQLCAETYTKLRKAYGADFHKERERIGALNL